MANVDVEVGERVHQEMWSRRVSQTTLAPKLGITQSTLSKKLRGTVPWSVAELMTTAGVLRVDPQELLPLLPRLDSNQQPAGNGPRLALVA